MRRLLVVAVAVSVAACTSGSGAPQSPPPPAVTAEAFDELLASSRLPVVVNVWASWCIPCRSEAPLLSAASATFAGSVRFVMLNVRDSPDDAARFIDEFFDAAVMEHHGDRSGNIPVHLGATRGVPVTFFFATGGELVDIHFGAIDERTVALQVDELLAR